MKPWQWDFVLFILASPILAIRGAVRFARRAVFLYQAAQPTMPCRMCGNPILLVGFWRCACGFTYEGHLLRFCPVCGSIPQMVRCYECGATEKVAM